MTLKGAKRRKYMKNYMRERRAAQTPAEVPAVEVRVQTPTVEIEGNSYPLKAEPVKPQAANRQFVKPISKHDQAHGWNHKHGH